MPFLQIHLTRAFSSPIIRFCRTCCPSEKLIVLSLRLWNSRLVIRASSESRLTSSHAARYSTRLDSTAHLRVLCCLMTSSRAGVDYVLVFLSVFDFPTCFAATEIMALLRRRMRRRRRISCDWKEHTDSSTTSKNACQ